MRTRAPVVAAHGAEIGVDVEILIVIRPGQFGIEAQLEMLLPIERGPGLGQLVIAVARAGDAQRDVGRVGGDLVRDAALLDVILFGQPQMLLGRDVAEHRRAMIRGRGRADATGDVVIARENVSHQRPKHVERRAVAQRTLDFHIPFDLIERHMPGAFNHDLHAVAPGAFGELAERFQFRQLRPIRRIREPARPQPIADTESDVVFSQDQADVDPTRRT